jgi:hypothetical protein
VGTPASRGCRSDRSRGGIDSNHGEGGEHEVDL